MQISFDNWDFTNGTDINFGDVLYQSKDDAIQKGLVGVNSAGHAFIKLDNTTDGTGDKNFGRDSVYITSQFTISPGNLLLFDAVHLPFGVCMSHSSQTIPFTKDVKVLCMARPLDTWDRRGSELAKCRRD